MESFCEASGKCLVRCATANPTEVILSETETGAWRVDGFGPQGVEDAAGIEWRRNLLRQIGYKLRAFAAASCNAKRSFVRRGRTAQSADRIQASPQRDNQRVLRTGHRP